MESLNIAVVSPDEAYNRVFCMSLLDACRQINVTAYTTKEFVLQWADHEKGAYDDQYDLVLWAGNEVSDSYGGCVVYLTDRASQVNIDHGNSRYALYKYSRADAIAAAVYDIYAHLTGRQALLVKRNNVRLIAFASYCGGAGCTAICRAVSQELARFRSRRVMYISLEDVTSSAEFLPLQEGGASGNIKTEGEYLYRLLGKNTVPFLESYLMKDPFGVCSFAPTAGKNPFRELSGEEMEQLLASLMDSGAFDVVAVDLSTSLGEGAMTVCKAADRICLIAKTEEPGMREKHYLRQLNSSCGEDIVNRIVRTVPVEERLPSPAASLEGFFGQQISKLTERLFDVVQ